MREEFVLPIEYHSIKINEIYVYYHTAQKFPRAVIFVDFTVSLQNEWTAIHVTTCKLCLQFAFFSME